MPPLSVLALFALPLAAAIGIALISRTTVAGLIILTALIPFEAFGAIEAGFTIPPSYLMLIVVIIGSVVRGERIRFDWPGSKAVAAYCTIAAVATIVAAAAYGSSTSVSFTEAMGLRASVLRSPLQLSLLFFHMSLLVLIVTHITRVDLADRMLKTHLGVASIVAAMGLYQIIAYSIDLPMKDFTWALGFSGGASGVQEYGAVREYSAQVAGFSTRATFFESLHFASYLNSVVPLLVALWASGSKDIRRRFGFFASPVASLLGMAALFLTFSRSGWIAAAIALTIVAIRTSPRVLVLHFPIAFAFLSLVTIALTGMGFLSASFISVITGRLDTATIAADPRLPYILVLAESFMQNPILGVGAGNFALLAPALTGSDQLHSAHGIFWSALADYGLLGLAALAAAYAAVIMKLNRAIRRSPDRSDQIVMIGLFSSLCGLAFQFLFCADRPPFYLLLLLGLSVVYSRIALDRSEKRAQTVV
jgi:hypothetical protein